MAEGEIKFVKVGQLKAGSYVLIDDCVCQIKGVEKSKPGKHGSAKCRITAIDIFTGHKKGLMQPTGADAKSPIIRRSGAQVVAVMGDTVQIMDLENYETYDVKRPSDITGLESGVGVEYVKYNKNVKITRKK